MRGRYESLSLVKIRPSADLKVREDQEGNPVSRKSGISLPGKDFNTLKNELRMCSESIQTLNERKKKLGKVWLHQVSAMDAHYENNKWDEQLDKIQ